jgi:hypothetical protein
MSFYVAQKYRHNAITMNHHLNVGYTMNNRETMVILKQNIITNIISRHLYARNRIMFNKVLISSFNSLVIKRRGKMSEYKLQT